MIVKNRQFSDRTLWIVLKENQYLCSDMPVELLRHITYSNQREAFKKLLPSADLTKFIDSYVIFESINLGDCVALSDGVPTLVFLSNPDINVTFTNKESSINIVGAWCCGQNLKQVKITCDRQIDQLLIIRFQADALQQLDAKTNNNLRGAKAFPLDSLFGKPAKNLLDLMYTTSDIRAKIGFFEQFIRRHLTVKHGQNGILREAMKYIGMHHGNISIQEVSKRVGTNYKWLERNFLQCIGISPKEYARTQRILRTCNYFEEGEDKLLSIALKSGFYDENHLLKDFKNFFGESPSSYWKRNRKES